MTDEELIARLRWSDAPAAHCAADRIEALRAENERLSAQLATFDGMIKMTREQYEKNCVRERDAIIERDKANALLREVVNLDTLPNDTATGLRVALHGVCGRIRAHLDALDKPAPAPGPSAADLEWARQSAALITIMDEREEHSSETSKRHSEIAKAALMPAPEPVCPTVETE